MTVRWLAAPLVILAVIASSCTGGSAESQGQSTPTQVSASPPANHGGYNGHRAQIFDAAYRTCYRGIAKTHGSLPTGLNSPISTVLTQATNELSVVAGDGCNAGLRGWGKANGVQVARVTTTIKASQ